VNDSIQANYTLWLTNGTKVDSSIDTGTPIEFRIGDTDVIPGFSEGFLGMKPGGVRQLVIPSQLAWGPRGSSVPGKVSVQPNANVIFEIEYLQKF
jgi:FKBP-type peptidyl-prolyl cis-trans isomerase